MRGKGAVGLEDPWRFRDVVRAVRTSRDGLQANAVLHACFPEQFDVMISGGHRRKLLQRFGTAPLVAEAADEDRKLLAVREVLSTHLPVAIAEPYDDAVRPVWDRPGSPEWDDLVARTSAALPPASASPDEADGAQPDPDVDLLERLQRITGTTSSWDELIREGAVRVAARGGTVRSWAPLVEALRTAAASVPENDDSDEPEPPPPPPGSQTRLRPVTAELASELLMSQGWLQRLVDLLAARRQVVLYGPPGTGKTWLARQIAAHAFAPEDVRLIQFHPSYAYEDFVEGYRPTTDNGVLTYALIQGPLRELSARAAARPAQPHLLIIDEINRGNLPKIFGELYFLLEYRDEPLRLQYSSDVEFKLPPNLYVVGTMNTADRSIALLDAALRRRFAFIELTPQAEPVHGLLQRWLDRHDLDPEPHVLLETLNELLIDADGDRDLAIGPAYFMNRQGTPPDLETVWEYDILPLLAERFYGTGPDALAPFGLGAVRQEATRRADALEPAPVAP